MSTEIIRESVNLGDIVFTSIFILLITLFFVSLVLFIRSWSRNQNKNNQKNINIEQRLDKIIVLLEKKRLINDREVPL